MMRRLFASLLLGLLSFTALPAQFFTNFDSFSTGACSTNLTGFTVQDIGTWSCNITDLGGGDDAVRMTDGGSGNDLVLVTYDAYETSDAVEAVVKIKLGTTADQNAPIGAALIAADGQSWAWRPTATPTATTWRMTLFNAAGANTATNICANISFTEPTAGTYFWVMVGIDDSNNVYGSVWLDGSGRPGSPLCTSNNTTLGTVKPGMIAFDSSDDPIDFGIFGAGNLGSAAPETDPGAGGVAPRVMHHRKQQQMGIH